MSVQRKLPGFSLPVRLFQKKTETIEEHRRSASQQGSVSSEKPMLGAAMLTDLRAEEEIELIVSPSLQAREVNLKLRKSA